MKSVVRFLYLTLVCYNVLVHQTLEFQNLSKGINSSNSTETLLSV